MRPATFRRLVNLWPPFLFSGIRVARIAPDFRAVDVELRQHWFNRHAAHGAHFGGSLFAMTDPFYAIMLSRALGRDFVVWDQAATIQFRSPGRGTVRATFILDDRTLAEIRTKAEGGDKVLHDFAAEIVDAAGAMVAFVEKTVYVRRRRAS